jgi:hypothetical protein
MRLEEIRKEKEEEKRCKSNETRGDKKRKGRRKEVEKQLIQKTYSKNTMLYVQLFYSNSNELFVA